MDCKFEDTKLTDTPLVRASHSALKNQFDTRDKDGLWMDMLFPVAGAWTMQDLCKRDSYPMGHNLSLSKEELMCFFMLSHIQEKTDVKSFAETLPVPLCDKFVPFMEELARAKESLRKEYLDPSIRTDMSRAVATCLFVGTLMDIRKYEIHVRMNELFEKKPVAGELREKGHKWLSEGAPVMLRACCSYVEGTLFDAYDPAYRKACADYGVPLSATEKTTAPAIKPKA